MRLQQAKRMVHVFGKITTAAQIVGDRDLHVHNRENQPSNLDVNFTMTIRTSHCENGPHLPLQVDSKTTETSARQTTYRDPTNPNQKNLTTLLELRADPAGDVLMFNASFLH